MNEPKGKNFSASLIPASEGIGKDDDDDDDDEKQQKGTTAAAAATATITCCLLAPKSKTTAAGAHNWSFKASGEQDDCCHERDRGERGANRATGGEQPAKNKIK